MADAWFSRSGGYRPIRAALCRFRKLPKPPAMTSRGSSATSIFSTSSNVSIPAQIALFASCSIRTSFWVSATSCVSEYASSSSAKAPVSSMISCSQSTAAASIIPLPQMPTAGASPMVWQHTCPSCHVTRSMAPLLACMPCEMVAPSNTGPAAVEQHSRRPSCHSASSPFVPMSAKSALSVFAHI